MRMSVGVDLHKKQFTVYWRVEGERERGEYERYLTNEEGYRQFEQKLRTVASVAEAVSVAVESTGNTRYFKNRVEALGISVVVVNTLKFKVVNESVKKTDRHDASTLAEFLEKDMLPTARLCSRESEELRRLVKARSSLVRTVVAVKNQIHGLLLSLGIESKRGELQSKKERRRVQSVLAAQHMTGAAVDPLFETIDRLTEEVKKLEAVMKELVKDDPVVELIRTIPGAGLITATTIRAYVDDIHRFDSPKQLAAYAGLTPWVQNSADREQHGRITKRGPNELRTALVQVVLGLVRNKRRTGTYRIMQRYDQMKTQKGSGRTIIATARKLSEIIWHMLNEGQPFDEARMKSPEIRRKAIEMRAAALDVA
jgi:transposase